MLIKVNEGDSIDKLGLDFSFIRNHEDLFKNYTVSFVGYLELEENNELMQIFSFPKHYKFCNDSNNKKEKIEIRNVLKTIQATKTQSYTFTEDGKFKNTIKELKTIIDYYKKFGIYQEHIKINSRSKGKIDWKKTMKKVTPLIKKEKSFLPNFLYSKKEKTDNIIGESMIYVFKNVLPTYSFFFDEIRLVNDVKLKNVTYYIRELKKIQPNIFNNEDKKLVLSLIRILEHQDSCKSKSKSLLTTSYELVYEKMIHYCLNNKLLILFDHGFKSENFEFQYKRTYIDDQYGIKDINIDHKSENYIIDSKYYSNLDNSKQFYKEIFYKIYLDQIYKKSHKLCLIFPSDETEYYGVRTIKPYESEIFKDFDIYFFKISINQLISIFLFSNSNIFIEVKNNL